MEGGEGDGGEAMVAGLETGPGQTGRVQLLMFISKQSPQIARRFYI